MTSSGLATEAPVPDAPPIAPPVPEMRNRILAMLPPEELDRLMPRLERLVPQFKAVLFDVDQPIDAVYFPEEAVVSVLGVMSDGSAVETATIGHEGMVGLPVFLGTDRTSAQAFVQITGSMLRMGAADFQAALREAPALTLALNRYTQALFTLVAQGSACNRMHTMARRCARWMLHTHDRVRHDEFPLTHEFLAQMLGVRRATVTEAMGAIQETGALSYQMGRVRVLDRRLLERESCECYAIIAREFDRLLTPPGDRVAPPANPLARTATAARGRTLIEPPQRDGPEDADGAAGDDASR
jgi:CRP-like cAMP-binding protein